MELSPVTSSIVFLLTIADYFIVMSAAGKVPTTILKAPQTNSLLCIRRDQEHFSGAWKQLWAEGLLWLGLNIPSGSDMW